MMKKYMVPEKRVDHVPLCIQAFFAFFGNEMKLIDSCLLSFKI